MSKKIIQALVLCSILFAVPLSTATAKSPEVYTFPISGSALVANCGNFEVHSEFSGTMRVTVKQWDPFTANTHYTTTDKFFRTDLNGNPVGKKYSVRITWNVIVNKHGWMELGANSHVVIPGAGSVLIDAGRIYSDNKGDFDYRGKHQVLEANYGRLCAAFR